MVSLNIEKKVIGELTKQNITKSNHVAIDTEDCIEIMNFKLNIYVKFMHRAIE